MSLWMVRGDKYGQHQRRALEEGFVYVMFIEIPDLTGAKSRKNVLEICRKALSDSTENRLSNFASQLYAFARRIAEGDLIAMPLRGKPQIAIGRVTGPYQYRTDVGGLYHTRPVEWLQEDIPRTAFCQDLLFSLGAVMTVCQIQRNNAEERVLAMLKSGKDPGPPGVGPGGGEEGNGPERPTDIEQLARDQILAHLEREFKGHNLARLVEAVLQAEGYITSLSAPGPDGGVDILAGRGLLGLERPSLCVQVKSSTSASDVTVFRTLQGSMATHKAEQGLLVSWGGFNKAVDKEARLSFFSVRLWDAAALVQAILKNYDRLPEEIRTELPLKRVWALVLEEE